MFGSNSDPLPTEGHLTEVLNYFIMEPFHYEIGMRMMGNGMVDLTSKFLVKDLNCLHSNLLTLTSINTLQYTKTTYSVDIQSRNNCICFISFTDIASDTLVCL
ncbi:hypothetical protein NPIL_321881 [Nephila pilipes]|uniref:Uncharacterized protein n=1 Tax=Nephila pilipes TaxID=299642 RepID=A0A8X6TPX4_NEPPI|nr:hypothetical protein NPIL_321881 [Nephila pilipes]